MQKECHPDANKAGPSHKPTEAAAASLNAAYQVLRSPLTRYDAILEHMHITPHSPPASLLYQHLQDREELEGLQARGSLGAFYENIQQRCEAADQSFYQAIDAQKVEDIVMWFHTLKFLHRILSDMANQEGCAQ